MKSGVVNSRWCERTWLGEAQPGTLTPPTVHQPWAEELCENLVRKRRLNGGCTTSCQPG